MKKIRVFEAFSGYGSQSIALENIGIPHEVVAISEIDKYAIQGYEAIHGETNNLGDISKIRVEDIPEHDLFTYSFPCQDISTAGAMRGLKKGETRSGLLYECKKIIEHCKPKYLLMENVKNLVGKKFREQFDAWLDYLESLGYTNYWQILNAKDYNIPQSRERVFVVSILGEHKPYKFPEGFKLDKNIKSLLEYNVDNKYYLSDEVVKKFVPNKNFTTKIVKDSNNDPKIVTVGFIKKSENGTKHQSNTVIDEDYLMRTLAACDYKSPQLIIVKDNIGGSETGFKIRKITPKECFRLMGLSDDNTHKIIDSGISATQQYKMAGNSIVIQVLEEIFKNLFLS